MRWLYLLAAVAGGLACASFFYKWWLDRVSRSWSVAEAKLEERTVSQTKFRRRYLLRLRYSYLAAGNLYGGTWFKYFSTLAEADSLWNSLNGLLVLVRYDPHRPERSYFDPYRDVGGGPPGPRAIP